MYESISVFIDVVQRIILIYRSCYHFFWWL